MDEQATYRIECPYCNQPYEVGYPHIKMTMVITCKCGASYERQWWSKPGFPKRLGIWNMVKKQ